MDFPSNRKAIMRTAFVFLLTLSLMEPALWCAARAVPRNEVCGANAACDNGLWCDPGQGKCGTAGAPGKCVEVPAVCAQLWQPVCGCDGKTYGNDCMRRAAKVEKKADGTCGPTK